VGALGLAEAQGARDGVKDTVRCAVHVPAFELRVVVDADAGQFGDLFAAEARDTPRVPVQHTQPDLLARDLRPTRHQELAHLAPGIHGSEASSELPLGGANSPPQALGS